MNLAQFPRRRYTEGQTPLEFLPRLTKALGGPNIWIKRDDMLGLAGGGNKTRKLEFLVADALAQGADTLITCGAVQSNHVRQTAAAAAKFGLACEIILSAGHDRAADAERVVAEVTRRLRDRLRFGAAVRIVSQIEDGDQGLIDRRRWD